MKKAFHNAEYLGKEDQEQGSGPLWGSLISGGKLEGIYFPKMTTIISFI